MSRRSLTLLVSGVLLIVLAVAAFAFPVPYATLTPGPSYDTLGTVQTDAGTVEPLIQVGHWPQHQTKGKLIMVTVDQSLPSSAPNLISALSDWWSNDVEVVPSSVVYPPGQSLSQSNAIDFNEFQSSQDMATVAAAAALGIKPTGTETVVSSVVQGDPASGLLQEGDVITTIDGTKVSSPNQAASLISAHKPGDVLVFGIVRSGKPQDVKITAGDSTSNPGHAMVGIFPGTQHTFPFTITFALQHVGGPSAGMMFSLGIIEKLSANDITGGLSIAGTGTIDDSGTVGPIAGVAMKVITARRAGATVFLTPAANCSDAKHNDPSGLRLVKVNTLQDALNALQAIRTGQGTVPCC